MLFVQLLCRRW